MDKLLVKILPINYTQSFTGKTCSPLLCYRKANRTNSCGNAIANSLGLLHAETGFSYFGARYYDSDLMTGWLSVDPMADKYPNLSTYNYCAWNPVRLVDPDGRKIDSATVSQNIWNMVTPSSETYNEKFANVFNQLATDNTTLFSFEKWDNPRMSNDGGSYVFGQIELTESSDLLDKIKISYTWGTERNGSNSERVLFEEVYHCYQFLVGEFGFGRTSLNSAWTTMGFDKYDEKEAHKWSAETSNSPFIWGNAQEEHYKDLPNTRRNVNEHWMNHDRTTRNSPPPYINGVFRDSYRTMRSPK
jgi:RHS repeat-associated protein